MAALRARYPGARFEGIGGHGMIAEGLDCLYPMERLSVMGLVEVLRHLPGLIRLRRALVRRLVRQPPDLFVGIDAPDFNLGLERRLRRAGVPCAQYVSPSVWAWRQGRVRTVARSVDLMLTLFPFEAEFYREHRVAVCWVGHPMADAIPEQVDAGQARRALGQAADGTVVALLPGSRQGEVGRLGPLFLDTAAWLAARRPGLRFLIPAATPDVGARLRDLLTRHGGDAGITLVAGRAREVLAAADVVLVASGTATLEATLVGRPMVMAYRLAPLTAWIGRHLVRISRFALPNLLARRDLVPEFIQERATVENLGPALLALLDDEPARERLRAEFALIHRCLRRDASRRAADALGGLLEARGPAAG